jgi:hypothetical protein
MNGIPPLVELLRNDYPEVQKNALGALKNMSYGGKTENKVRQKKLLNRFLELFRLGSSTKCQP